MLLQGFWCVVQTFEFALMMFSPLQIKVFLLPVCNFFPHGLLNTQGGSWTTSLVCFRDYIILILQSL